MKTLTFYLMLLVALSQITLLQGQPLLNGGFEDWQSDTLFTDFPPYSTSNAIAYILSGAPNVIPVPGCNGSATGVLLTSIEAGGEILPGVLNWNDNPNDIRGVPYTGQPDTFKACISYDIMPGDSAAIRIFMRQSNGTIIAGAQGFLTGTQLTPIEYALPLVVGAVPPDSLVLVIASSHFDNRGMEGSTLMIDDMRFTGTTEQLPNGDFEMNTLLDTEVPKDWGTVNDFQIVLDGPPSVTKSNDSFSGMYALQLKTELVEFDGTSDTIGFMSNGVFNGEDFIGGQPYAHRPGRLVGQYKYTAVGNDTAIGLVAFSSYNPGTDETVYSDSFWVKLGPTAVYASFEVPINLSGFSRDPDTVVITFGSSDFSDGELTMSTKGVGSTLLLDELVFEGGNVAIDGIREPKAFSLYPNPATSSVSLTWPEQLKEPSLLSFYSLQGQLMKQNMIPAGAQTHSVLISELPSGVYIVKWQEVAGKIQAIEKLIIYDGD